MSEVLLMSAVVDVMFYEDSTKQWLRPGETGALTSIDSAGPPDTHKYSNVQLWQSGNRAVFRIVAKRIYDGRTLIEQTIFQKLKYQATKCFHQWRSENRQVCGLSFANEQDADKFFSFVQNALEYISSSNGHYQPVNGHVNNGNGHYQEAIYYQQQQSNESHYKDPDEESLGSANGLHSNGYRKSSYNTNGANASVSSNTLVQPQPQMVQQQLHASAIQRRASQGSNSSGSNSMNGLPMHNGINGNSSNACHPNGVGRPVVVNAAALNPHIGVAQPSVVSAQSSSSAETALSTTCSSSSAMSTAPPPAPPPPPPASAAVPPISKNAPPPPPPPPPSLKGGNTSKPLSMAESLKQAKLRNVSAAAANNGVNRTSNSNSTDSGIGSKSSTISSTTSGHVNLLSELEATIQKRKTNVEGKPSSAGEANERRPNGENMVRPWQKLSNATSAVTAAASSAAPSSNGNGAVDSPRIQRKTVSGASLCSQEEPKMNGNAPVTFADLERFKQGMIAELNKAKQEILLAIRQEFAQLHAN